MMSKITLGIASLALVIAGVAITRAPDYSGVRFEKDSFVEGLYAGTNRQFEVTRGGTTTVQALTSTGDGTVSGGTFTVTTSNSATSTLVVGCVQFYATSTATAHKFQASTTPGIMVSQYGTCPNR